MKLLRGKMPRLREENRRSGILPDTRLREAESGKAAPSRGRHRGKRRGLRERARAESRSKLFILGFGDWDLFRIWYYLDLGFYE